MARRQGGDVVIVEVRPIVTYGSPITGVSGILPFSNSGKTASLTPDVVASLQEWLPGRWHFQLRHGDPVDELEQIGEEMQSDAIVLGQSHGTIRHPLGSVAA